MMDMHNTSSIYC